jgi:Flp pilus assembly pilin Flp
MLINWCRRVVHGVDLLLRRLVRDDAGQDLIEYALLTGIIAIAGILLFPTIQSKMAAAYQDWNDNAQAIWEAPPPM